MKLTAVPSVPTAASSGQLSAAASASNRSNGHRSNQRFSSLRETSAVLSSISPAPRMRQTARILDGMHGLTKDISVKPAHTVCS